MTNSRDLVKKIKHASVAKSMGAGGAQGMSSNGATGSAALTNKAKMVAMVKSFRGMQKSGPDEDSHMALSSIKSMAHHINEILASTNFNEDLEDWVDAKITLAADYLATVAHYLEGNQGDQELTKSCEGIHGAVEAAKIKSASRTRRPA